MFPKLKRPRLPVQPKSNDDAKPEDGHGAQMGLLDHLDELRVRLTRAFIALVIGTVVGFFLSTPALQYLISPYGERLQTLGPTESVVSYFRVSLLIGGSLSIPVITYQLLMFILPGLTRKEKRILLMSLPAITLLFVVGVSFAWFLLVPPALDFLANFQTEIFRAEWQADQYLGFITALMFWMGVAFETPLIFFVISLLGFITAGVLLRNWRIAIVASAVAAAMITPTIDPVNMFLVMGPLLALYTLSIFLVVIGRRISRVDAA